MKKLVIGVLLSALVVAPRQTALSRGIDVPPQLQAIELALSKNDLRQADVDELQKYLSAHPDSAAAHYIAGKIYEHSGLSGLAQEEFEKADKLAPNQSESVLESFAGKLESNDIAGAMQDFGYLADRFPEEPSVLLMWAMIYNGKERPDLAEAYLKEALTVAPIRVGVAAAAASIRLSQHRDEEAMNLAKQDLVRDKDNYLANAVAGQACMRLGKREEGGRYLRHAFKLRPLEFKNDNAFAASFYKAGMYGDSLAPAMVYMASCLDAKELNIAKQQMKLIMKQLPSYEIENVVQIVDDLLKKTPYRGRLHLAIGDLCDQMGWFTLAEHHYMIGIGIDSAVGRAWYRLGLDYQRQGKLKAAQFLFERAHALQPKDSEINLALLRSVERRDSQNNDLARALKESLVHWLAASGSQTR